MSIYAAPKIVSTNPKNYAKDIETSTKLVLEFSTDMNPDHLLENIRLQGRTGDPAEVWLAYSKRKLTITPQSDLTPNTTYQLTIYGDSDLDNKEITGVRSVLGTPMQGNGTLTFTTSGTLAIWPPDAIDPKDKKVLHQVPEFKWNDVSHATHYEIEVSMSNSMSPVHWFNTHVTQTSIIPNQEFKDGVHYWRIRSVNIDDKISDWSSIYTFNLDTQKESPVTPEDGVAPEDEYYDVHTPYVEIIDTFPKQEASHIKENLQTISFTVLGEVNQADISMEMVGEHVLGEDEDHGRVKGRVVVQPNGNGTTTIAFIPASLDGEEDEDETIPDDNNGWDGTNID